MIGRKVKPDRQSQQMFAEDWSGPVDEVPTEIAAENCDLAELDSPLFAQ